MALNKLAACQPDDISHRKAIGVIPASILIDYLTQNIKEARVMLPSFENVPAGVEVLGVNGDFVHDRILIKMRHPSFTPVPEGVEIPHFELVVSSRAAEVRDDKVESRPFICIECGATFGVWPDAHELCTACGSGCVVHITEKDQSNESIESSEDSA